MENITKILSPQNIMWAVIIIALIIGKIVAGLNYISVIKIIKNHYTCFKNENGKVMIFPMISYTLVPILMGGATVLTKKIDSTIINIITIIVSILTTMLFTLLAMVIDMKGKIKSNPNYFSMEAKISRNSLIETYYTIMFEILISVILLILCLFNCFTQKFGNIQSFLIYSLTYILLVNLLMIIKRIFNVIDTEMNK